MIALGGRRRRRRAGRRQPTQEPAAISERVPGQRWEQGEGWHSKPCTDIAPQTATGKILVGTSGWSYRHWRGVFYPERLAGQRGARLLRRALRHGRGQSHVLLAARGGHHRALARDGAPGLLVRGQGAPPDHPHEAPAAQRGSRWPTFSPACAAWVTRSARSCSSCPDGFPRDTGLLRNFLDMLPRDLAYAFEFRDRELVSGPHLRPAGRPRGRVLHLPPGRPRDAARRDGAVRLPAPAWAGHGLRRRLRPRGAAALGRRLPLVGGRRVRRAGLLQQRSRRVGGARRRDAAQPGRPAGRLGPASRARAGADESNGRLVG